MTSTILFLPGDGIGPEVMEEVRRVASFLARRQIHLDIEEDLVGGAAIDRHGTPLAEATLRRADEIGTVMFGAVGGPAWDGLPFDRKPERGLLALRKTLDLFANLRPAMIFPALAGASSLKPELVQGLDIVIVRELTGGVYFGQPRGIEDLVGGGSRAVDTQVYTTPEITRVAAVAFELARGRRRRLTSVEKANVMHTGILWRRTVSALHVERFADVELDHLYADNCAMQLVRAPKQFDVIVTDNLFGDLLSDCAAMLTGSLGMLPSASLGAADAGGRRKAMYEPVHGSAPDIAGQGIANPIACLMSFSMLLRWSLGEAAAADALEAAIGRVLDDGWRTADIMQDGMTRVSTSEMGAKVMEAFSAA